MPTLLVHGTADWRVDVGQARRFAARHGELITYDGDGHELWAHRAAARAAIDQFFSRSLLPAVVLNHVIHMVSVQQLGFLRRDPSCQVRLL